MKSLASSPVQFRLAGAPPVVLLGYDVWRTRFAGDSRVVGRTVQIDDAFATIVGVMPEGYKFPVSHEMWMPRCSVSCSSPKPAV